MGGQKVLEELVEFHGVPVFNDIQTAVKCTAKVSFINNIEWDHKALVRK